MRQRPHPAGGDNRHPGACRNLANQRRIETGFGAVPIHRGDQQLARAGHIVDLYERESRPGGLLRYGIPDFKMEKSHIDRRVAQMEAEGVTFRTKVCVGAKPSLTGINDDAVEVVSADQLKSEFDAVILAAGSEVPRDLPVPGRELAGVHFALELLVPQNKEVAGDGANRDLDGYFWIMGRVDDVINVAGHRLGTMEIESALVKIGRAHV